MVAPAATFWALYRKMYGWFVAWVFILIFFGLAGRAALTSPAGSFWVMVANFAVVIGFAAYANSLYHLKVKARIATEQKPNSDAAWVSRRLSAGGGVHMWVPMGLGGLTVLGVVAAVALPAYEDYTKRQTVAASAAQSPVQQPDFTYTPTKDQFGGKLVQTPAQVNPFSDPNFGKTAPAQSERGPWEENYRVQNQQSFSVSLDKAVAAIEGEISSAYNYRMLPEIGEIENRYPVFRTVAGQAAVRSLMRRREEKLAGFALPKQQARAQPSQVASKLGLNPQAQADLDSVAARAISDYPYLNTAAGKIVMGKITKMRDELIQQGHYPAIALTQAVSAFAPANAPTVAKEKISVQKPDEFSQGGCRWATAKDWVCN